MSGTDILNWQEPRPNLWICQRGGACRLEIERRYVITYPDRKPELIYRLWFIAHGWCVHRHISDHSSLVNAKRKAKKWWDKQREHVA